MVAYTQKEKDKKRKEISTPYSQYIVDACVLLLVWWWHNCQAGWANMSSMAIHDYSTWLFQQVVIGELATKDMQLASWKRATLLIYTGF